MRCFSSSVSTKRLACGLLWKRTELWWHLGPSCGCCCHRNGSAMKLNYEQRKCVSNAWMDFPWRQNASDKIKDDPIHHKLVGMILLRRVLKNTSREEFKLLEFINGVKHAVKALSSCIQAQDSDDTMTRMLGSDLQSRFRQAFDEMKKAKERIILEVESTRDFRISGVRSIFGSADLGDEYYISVFGQKIITSRRDMFELEKRVDSTGYGNLFDYGKKLGISAAEKQLRFQIDVSFSTSERYYIEQKKSDGWRIVFGGIDIVSAMHRLRFESTLQDKSASFDDYPLSWKIVDIDYEDDNAFRNENDNF